MIDWSLRIGNVALHANPQLPSCSDDPSQACGFGTALRVAIEANEPANMMTIHENTTARADEAALRKVFDQINIFVPASMPTPVIAKTGMMSRSTVSRPRTAARAMAWIVVIELKIIDAPRVPPMSQSWSCKIMGMSRNA